MTSPKHINTNAKKKAIVITRFPFESSWGGEESHTLHLAFYFRNQGYEVIFMGSCPVLAEKFTKQHFPVYQPWGGKMIVTPWELIKSLTIFPFIKWSLQKTFKSILQHYDVKALYCLSLNEKLFLTPFALKKNIPVTWVEHQEIRNWLLKNPWKKRYQNFAQQVKIVPISKKNEELLVKVLKIPTMNIHFIINGVDVYAFINKKRTTTKGMVLAANRLIPKKGIADLLEAIEIMKGQLQYEKFLIRGEGEELSTLKKFIHARNLEDYVSINNFLKKEKWHATLLSADVYVSCARDSNETFSLNTAEAMAAGCKVVVTTCSGIADFLEDGKDAFLCEPNNSKELAKKIQQALSASEEMREQAILTAREKFDRKRMHQQYFSLILRQHE